MALIVPQAELDALNPDILKYPCPQLGEGILPMPLMSGYKYRHGTSVVRKNMDIGLSAMRRRVRVAVARFELPFVFVGEQKEAFESWIFNELDAGVEWFYMPLQVGDYTLEVLKVRFIATPGEDSAFEFLGYTSDGQSRWGLTATVEGFRERLGKYAARVTVKDTTQGLESAADALVNAL